jgi:methionyl-tRNA formyltransferase
VLQVIQACAPDVIVVAAYGLILPGSVLAVPRAGCLNIHASLLPRWRGAAPIQRAILAGDRESGISIMQMDEGLDTGPILLTKRAVIGDEETGGSLTERLAELGAAAIVEALANLGGLAPMPQDPAGATYASKIVKSEARIDWHFPSRDVERRVRALNPVPGAETLFQSQPLKVWRGRCAAGRGRPGEVLYSRNNQLIIACGEGALEVLEIQRPGGRRMPVTDFLRGAALDEGSELGEKPLASP